MYKLIIPTVLGDIAIVEQGGKITHLFLHAQQAPAHAPQAQTPLLRQAARQINEFFAGTRFYFDLPLAAHGTDFERQVWDVLCTIPYGQTLSYGAVARRLGRPGAARAVGRACHQNPIALLIRRIR